MLRVTQTLHVHVMLPKAAGVLFFPSCFESSHKHCGIIYLWPASVIFKFSTEISVDRYELIDILHVVIYDLEEREKGRESIQLILNYP